MSHVSRNVVVYLHLLFFIFFFFKQKTAYEMRISDWSSDVCSSDLGAQRDSPAVHRFGDLAVHRGLFLDIRCVRPAEEQELGTDQARVIGAGRHGGPDRKSVV